MIYVMTKIDKYLIIKKQVDECMQKDTNARSKSKGIIFQDMKNLSPLPGSAFDILNKFQ